MKDEAKQVIKQDLAFGRWPRVALQVVGALLIGAGIAAVFATASPTGLIATLVLPGAILLMIGASGRLPTKLKFWQVEVEWLVVKALETAVGLIPREHIPEMRESLQELKKDAPAAAASALSVLDYNARVLQMIETSVAELEGKSDNSRGLRWQRDVRLVEATFDGVVATKHGSSVVVEVKGYTKPIGASMIQELIERARAASLTRILLATRSGLTKDAQDKVTSSSGMVHVHLDSPDQDALTRALELLLAHT